MEWAVTWGKNCLAVVCVRRYKVVQIAAPMNKMPRMSAALHNGKAKNWTNTIPTVAARQTRPPVENAITIAAKIRS